MVKKSFLKNVATRILKCEICGSLFKCNNLNHKDCWCFKVPIIDISPKIKDCICKNCLTKKN